MTTDKTTTRQNRTLDRLTLALAELRLYMWNLQCQTFEYVLISPSDEHMRLSLELYNLRCNMGEIIKTECPF